jgi:hypothetical protein
MTARGRQRLRDLGSLLRYKRIFCWSTVASKSLQIQYLMSKKAARQAAGGGNHVEQWWKRPSLGTDVF